MDWRTGAGVFAGGMAIGLAPTAALFSGLPNVKDAYRSFGDVHRRAMGIIDLASGVFDASNNERGGGSWFRAGYYAGLSVPALGLGAMGFGAYKMLRRRYLTGGLSLALGALTLAGSVAWGRKTLDSLGPMEEHIRDSWDMIQQQRNNQPPQP